MHQQPRAPPRTASAANNLQTNPSRTNNSRNTPRSPTFPDSYSYSEREQDDGDRDISGTEDPRSDADRTHQVRIRQIIQQFFCKAALMIVSTRVALPKTYTRDGDVKVNKWYNIVIDDTEELSNDIAEWKRSDLAVLPPPLCIEVYLDLQDLTSKQILVISDEHGKRWNVADMLGNRPRAPSDREFGRTENVTQIVLERWIVEVKDQGPIDPAVARDSLPNVYKKAVVLFRTLWSMTHMLPAYKYRKNLGKQTSSHPGLKLKYRISNTEYKHPRRDTLVNNLTDSSTPTTDTYEFAPSNSPVGPLSMSVVYRNNCDFRVDDSESLLSSQFMGLDDDYFKPSLGGVVPAQSAIPGSLPVTRAHQDDRKDLGQAYGSMSSFHQIGPPPGTSPISALRAVRDQSMESPSDSDSAQKHVPSHRVSVERKPSLRSGETGAYQRRPSVSFQPFKAGSLSSSPALGTPVPPSPSSSLGRTASGIALTTPRNRTSLTALPQTALRTPSLPNETAIASSASSSPKPAPISRYSSSFGHRRNRFSSGGGSKIDDDNASSGKASVASSAPPGSGMLNEGEGGSSGSIQTDDENISDFLKLLDAKKELKSFNRRDSAARDATMRRTTAALSRYKGIRERDSHGVLSDSMSSSLIGHRSSSSSSRQLSSVPPMIAGTSVSTASSPGKPISPHTPHTPAIPSRLSANSIVEYDQPRRSSRGRANQHPRSSQLPAEDHDSDERSSGTGTTTTAIPIPTSPRAWPYQRRSSSAAQQHRNMDDDYGLRSASMPTEERPDLSLSELVRLQEPVDTASTAHGRTHPQDDDHSALPPLDLEREDPDASTSRPDSQDDADPDSRGSSARTALRLRTRASSGRGNTGRSRFSFSSRVQDDEEPLLFYMSELGAMSRRSGEGSASGSGSGSAVRDERRGGGRGSASGRGSGDNRLGGDW